MAQMNKTFMLRASQILRVVALGPAFLAGGKLAYGQSTPIPESVEDFKTRQPGVPSNFDNIAKYFLNPALRGLAIYTPTWPGSQPRNIVDKLSDRIDLAEAAGVDLTGTSDSTTALQAAATYAASQHKTLYGCGTVKISAAITVSTTDGVANIGFGLEGCSDVGLIINTTNATQDGIVITSPGGANALQSCSVRKVQINSGTAGFKTAGSGIRLVGTNNCVVESNRINGQFYGIRTEGSTVSHISRNWIYNGSANGDAITLTGHDVASYVTENFIGSPVGSPARAGISLLDNTEGTYLTRNQTNFMQYGLLIQPTVGTTGKVQNIFSLQNAWDSSTVNAFLADSTNGQINRIKSNDDWYGGAAGVNSVIVTGGTNTMSDWEFVTPHIFAAGGSGALFQGPHRELSITAPMATGNSIFGVNSGNGIELGANVIGASIIGGFAKQSAEYPNNQTFGIVLQSGASDWINIRGVSFGTTGTGATDGNRLGGILNQSTGTHNRIDGNPGYNPIGVTGSTTVGASPATICAGPTPETHYLRQSATNTATVSIGGAVVGTMVNANSPITTQLGSNECEVVTWATTAPTYTKSIH